MSTTPAAHNGVAAPRRRATAKRRRKALPWARLSDEELLKLRFCDLKLTLERSPLKRQISRLYEELRNARKGSPAYLLHDGPPTPTVLSTWVTPSIRD